MNSGVVTVLRSKEPPTDAAGQREELVRRVASSCTFERSPRLQAFFLYVCRCALENKPEEVTEQQIGINVYGREPGYNPNEDNIVRSQARLLRLKLEHHFVNEGKDEAVVITIPKGHYLPVFETRSRVPVTPTIATEGTERKPHVLRRILIGAAVLLGLAIVWLGYKLFESGSWVQPHSVVTASSVPRTVRNAGAPASTSDPIATAAVDGEVRIAAGHTRAAYVDALGHRWEADRYFDGGVIQAGPRHFFPPVADDGPFRSMVNRYHGAAIAASVPLRYSATGSDLPA